MFNIIDYMIAIIKKHPQISKYIFFAVICSGINIIVYLLCYDFIIDNIFVSNIIAYICSIFVSFFLNRDIVFKNKCKRLKFQITTYLIVKGISFIIDSGVLFILKDVLGLNNFLSKLIANCSTTVSNYTLNKKWVFKNNKKDIFIS